MEDRGQKAEAEVQEGLHPPLLLSVFRTPSSFSVFCLAAAGSRRRAADSGVPAEAELAAWRRRHARSRLSNWRAVKSPPFLLRGHKGTGEEATEPNRPGHGETQSAGSPAAALANNWPEGRTGRALAGAAAVDIERARFESVFRASASYSRTELQGMARARSERSNPVWRRLCRRRLGHHSSAVTDTDGVSEAAASVSVISRCCGARARRSTPMPPDRRVQRGSVDAFTKLRAIDILASATSLLESLRGPHPIGGQPEQYKLAENQVRIAVSKWRPAPRQDRNRTCGGGLSGALDGVISAETAVRDSERSSSRS